MKKHVSINLGLIGLIAISGLVANNLPDVSQGVISVFESNSKTENVSAPKEQAIGFQGITAAKSEGGKEGENKSWFEYDINPGESESGKIVLQNKNNESELIANMYVVGSNLGQSAFVPNSKGEPGPDAKWISLEPKTSLEAGETIEVPFTINIPKNATPGSHVLAIMTETSSPEEAKEKTAKGNSSKVTIATNIGVRVYINVGGELKTSAKIGDLSMLSENPYEFKISVVNTGNTIIRPTIKVEAEDKIRGNTIAITNEKKRYEYEIFPGGNSDMHIQWDYSDMGIYIVKFKVQYNGKTEERSVKIVIYPSLTQVAIGIGGLLVIILIIFNIVYMIRRKKGQEMTIATPSTPQSNGQNPPPPSPPIQPIQQ